MELWSSNERVFMEGQKGAGKNCHLALDLRVMPEETIKVRARLSKDILLGNCTSIKTARRKVVLIKYKDTEEQKSKRKAPFTSTGIV